MRDSYIVSPDLADILAENGIAAIPANMRPVEAVARGLSLGRLFVNRKDPGFTLNVHFGRDDVQGIPLERGDAFDLAKWAGGAYRNGLYFTITDALVPVADMHAVLTLTFANDG